MVISEIANGGPGGYHDNFIEIANWGDEPVDVSGWELFRCTGAGSVASAPQNTLQGTIGAGERWLFARESDQSTIADADVEQRYSTSLAYESYGALLRDSSGEDIDAVAVQFPGTANQACGEGTVLANTTDSAAGESFQRTQDTDDNAADFIRAPRTPGAENATDPSAAPKRGDVIISEVAHTGTDGEGLIEVANFGDQEVDIADLRVDVVNQFGRRFAGYVWAERMPVEKLGPSEVVVVPRDEGGRDFTEGTAGVVLYGTSGYSLEGVAYRRTPPPPRRALRRICSVTCATWVTAKSCPRSRHVWRLMRCGRCCRAGSTLPRTRTGRRWRCRTGRCTCCRRRLMARSG